jgi:hypothetical protein
MAFGISYLTTEVMHGPLRRLSTVTAALLLATVGGQFLGVADDSYNLTAGFLLFSLMPTAPMRNWSCLLLMAGLALSHFTNSFPLHIKETRMAPRNHALHTLNEIFPDSFSATMPAFDPGRVFAIPRPAWLLFEPMILQKNAALTTILELPPGNPAELAYMKYWQNSTVGNRTIYWPAAYLKPYLLGEENIHAFFDIMGVDRKNIRFYRTSEVMFVEDEEATRLFKTQSQADYRLTDHALLLSKLPPNNDRALPTNARELMDQANTEVLAFTDNSIKIQVSTTEPGYLLYNDTLDRNWRAWVNGERQEILKANLSFKAVSVPIGVSVVEFTYAPRFFIFSTWIYILCVFSGFIICFVNYKKWSLAELLSGPNQ